MHGYSLVAMQSASRDDNGYKVLIISYMYITLVVDDRVQVNLPAFKAVLTIEGATTHLPY